MRARVLMYHDVVQNGEWDASGFPGVAAARYKLDRQHFADHLQAIAERILSPPVRITDVIDTATSTPLLLTFDDGGESAHSRAAGMLEGYGWRGHFFVTTDHIGSPAFMTRDQIRDLHRRGHLIGSHCASHALRLTRCTQSELEGQWRTSIDVLSDVIGEPVDTASVPGGQYSRAVAAAAAAQGIRVLFTSEPTTAVREVEGILVVGRFAVLRQTTAHSAAMLASGDFTARTRQRLAWHAKQAARTASEDRYLAVRGAMLHWLGVPQARSTTETAARQESDPFDLPLDL